MGGEVIGATIIWAEDDGGCNRIAKDVIIMWCICTHMSIYKVIRTLNNHINYYIFIEILKLSNCLEWFDYFMNIVIGGQQKIK